MKMNLDSLKYVVILLFAFVLNHMFCIAIGNEKNENTLRTMLRHNQTTHTKIYNPRTPRIYKYPLSTSTRKIRFKKYNPEGYKDNDAHRKISMASDFSQPSKIESRKPTIMTGKIRKTKYTEPLLGLRMGKYTIF